MSAKDSNSDTNVATTAATPASPDQPQQKKVRRRVKITWDEETIKEHDKLRGTRMKIDEPDTPFNGAYVPSDDDEDADNKDTTKTTSSPAKQMHVSLEASVGELEKELASNPKSRWEADDPEASDKKRKHEEFMKKRAQHYNMGERMRQARLAIQKELEEEEAAAHKTAAPDTATEATV